MIDAKFDLDLRDLDRGFGAMVKAARNLKPAFRRIEPFMETDQIEHFENQEGSDGDWPPLAASTRARRLSKSSARAKRSGRKPPKRASGKLLGNKMPKAFRILIRAKEISAYSLIDWAESHQFGGRVGRGAQLPKREHLWLSEKFLKRAFPEIEKFLVKKFGRAAA